MHPSPLHVTDPILQLLVADGSLAGNWVLDSNSSTVGLETRHLWGLAPVKGHFGKIGGAGTVSAADGRVTGTFAVGAVSIDTANARRDAHLRSPAFFDIANHPHITFTVDDIGLTGPGITVTGTLTVRDVSRRLTFHAAPHVQDDGEIWLDAEVGVNRADFGLTWNFLGMASMDNKLTIHAVFSRRACSQRTAGSGDTVGELSLGL